MRATPDRRWLVSGFFTVFFLGAAGLALTFRGPDRSMPLLVAVPGLALSLVQLLADIAAARRRSHADSADTPATVLPMLAWLGLLMILCTGGGLTLGSSLFIVLYLRAAGAFTWQRSLISGGIFGCVQYTVFTGLLDITLYRGPVMLLPGL